MTRKVVFKPEDFTKIFDYMNAMQVPFSDIEKAIEVKAALKRYIIMDIDIKENKTSENNEA